MKRLLQTALVAVMGVLAGFATAQAADFSSWSKKETTKGVGKMSAKCCMSLFAALVGLFCSGVRVFAEADTHFVSLDGNNTSPYTNGWASAATQIQWAVNAATTGDTVVVSNGTYNLTNQINILSNITVRSFREQGHGSNDTIINGNYPNYTNRCVFMARGTLDGFTVSNGFLTNGTVYTRTIGGAGIGILGANVSVLNCCIQNNFITNFYGGGVHVCHTGTIISNCTVAGNTSDASLTTAGGGGLYLDYLDSGVLIDSYISGNIGGNGGGIFDANSAGRITNCTIAGNTAKVGYGGVYLLASAVTANCVISNNSCIGPYSVGGIYVRGSQLINSTIIGNTGGQVGGVWVTKGGSMSNCQVIANRGTNAPAAAWIPAGGVYIEGAADSANVVVNCIIASNVVPNWSNGDAAAGLYLQSGGLAKNCLIYGNTNRYGGGGVRLFSDKFYTNYPYGLINCTIVDNKAPSQSGLSATGSTNYIANCIIVSNVTPAGAQSNIYNSVAANTNNYWYNCAPDVLPSNQGNIAGDPLFADYPNRNYRLRVGSPCVNTGTNWSWTATDVDYDGQKRIRYGWVDMGAYELIIKGTIFKIR